jgi:hypothetical protein
MHNFEKDCGSYVLSMVAVEQPAYAIAEYLVIVQEIKLCKGVWITARPSDKIGVLVFAKGQGPLPLHPFFANSICHRNYKRVEKGKRCKKSEEISEISI